VSADRLDPRHHTGLPGPGAAPDGNDDEGDAPDDDGGDDGRRVVVRPAVRTRQRRRPQDTGTQLSFL